MTLRTKSTPFLPPGLPSEYVSSFLSQSRDIYLDLRELSASIQTVTQRLKIENNATNPTYQIDVDAERIEIEDEVFTSLDLTLDITSSGAGGLDTGSEAADTWYFIWLITGSAGPDGLLSTSSTAPTLPSNFTGKRLLGAVRNDASSNFLSFSQVGRRIFYKGRYSVLAGGTSATYASIDLSSYIPSIARQVAIEIQASAASAPSAGAFISWDGSTDFASSTYSKATGATAILIGGASLVPATSTQTIYYKIAPLAAASVITIWVNGFAIEV